MTAGRQGTMATIVVAMLGGACADSAMPTAMANDQLVPGAEARVTYEEVTWAGGIATHVTTVIDSSTSRYTVTTCRDVPIGSSCPIDGSSMGGEALATSRDRLFQKAQSSAFRGLAPSYSRPPTNVVPPDDAVWSVTVTANGRRRTVTWERGATIPSVLASFACTIAVARGDLIICAE